MPYSKNDKHYSVGDKLKIYYHPENPTNIDLDVNNSRKTTVFISRIFIFISLMFLFSGIYLTFYYR